MPRIAIDRTSPSRATLAVEIVRLRSLSAHELQARWHTVFRLQGRNWLNELVTNGTTDVDAMAKRQRRSVRKINMTISLAFLAPELVKAIIEGRLPRGIGIARLCDSPAAWSGQYRKLGLTSPYQTH